MIEYSNKNIVVGRHIFILMSVLSNSTWQNGDMKMLAPTTWFLLYVLDIYSTLFFLNQSAETHDVLHYLSDPVGDWILYSKKILREIQVFGEEILGGVGELIRSFAYDSADFHPDN